VAVDVADVDPDHPLYGLERLGERIRMVGDFDQMKERCGEALRMCEKVKGSQYRRIIEEFLEKMKVLTPEDVAPPAEVVDWIRDHMPDVAKIEILMLKEAAGQLKHDAPADILKKVENFLKECGECERGLTAENLDNVLARLKLIRERIENVRKAHPRPVDRVKICVDITVTISVEAEVVYPRILVPVENLEKVYATLLAAFDTKYAELVNVLETLPDTHTKRVATKLAEQAKAHRDAAVELYNAGRLRVAIARLYAAHGLLTGAERIVEHAHQWEAEYAEKFYEWGEYHREMVRGWREKTKELAEGIADIFR